MKRKERKQHRPTWRKYPVNSEGRYCGVCGRFVRDWRRHTQGTATRPARCTERMYGSLS